MARQGEKPNSRSAYRRSFYETEADGSQADICEQIKDSRAGTAAHNKSVWKRPLHPLSIVTEDR
jgi:hypothetical protein